MSRRPTADLRILPLGIEQPLIGEPHQQGVKRTRFEAQSLAKLISIIPVFRCFEQLAEQLQRLD